MQREENGMSMSRMILLAFGVVQLVMSRKIRAGFLLTLVGGFVLGAVGVAALVNSRRRPRHWTDRLADRLGVNFNSREAEATIHHLSREVDRLRGDVSDRLSHSFDSREAEATIKKLSREVERLRGDVSERLSQSFDSREAEATIKKLSREVERLRNDVEERLQAQTSKAADLLHR